MTPAESETLLGQARLLGEGRLRNPFGLLGPHTAEGKPVVRTFQPGAARVDVVDRDGEWLAHARRIGDTDLFVAEVPDIGHDYRLRLQCLSGSIEREDPYRFTSLLGELDLHLIGEGRHYDLYRKLGAHCTEADGVRGVLFAVWAPNAHRVSVVGDFNEWDGRRHVMRLHPAVGVWDIFVPGIAAGSAYKFELLDRDGRLLPLKADPFAAHSELAPGNASLVFESGYCWRDAEWLARRPASFAFDAPVSIYEVHLGSWRRRPEDHDRRLSYRELAVELIPYVVGLGFTHVELMPVSEHPFDGSWGYQPTGLFAPTSRFGNPDDFRYFVDCCHEAGIGVILDWVGAHFPSDPHGLVRFDGTALYEHEDPRRGVHADWDTLIFNYGRTEVLNYLISNALYWIRSFHIDALRMDAVASMLYLDYSRRDGEWLPNAHGGNENLEAIAFIRRLNELVHAEGAVTIAEESTAWPGVSRPVYAGGLGFSYKWNMGWMNDSLSYMSEDPVHRKHHHDKMTFGLVYAFDENFVLPLSHDEVVHGKRSILGRMPGDDWQRFAGLRAYYGFMFAHPGKKLLFMGDEFAQDREWNHDRSLDWHLLDDKRHAGVQLMIGDLNRLYRTTPALHARDVEADGFCWIDWNDRDNSVLSWIRFGRDGGWLVCAANFTPVVRHDYQLGVPAPVRHAEVFNSDAAAYGGSGCGNGGFAEVVSADPCCGQPASIRITLPPLASVYLVPVRD